MKKKFLNYIAKFLLKIFNLWFLKYSFVIIYGAIYPFKVSKIATWHPYIHYKKPKKIFPINRKEVKLKWKSDAVVVRNIFYKNHILNNNNSSKKSLRYIFNKPDYLLENKQSSIYVFKDLKGDLDK